jgi:hypothetical protein
MPGNSGWIGPEVEARMFVFGVAPIAGSIVVANRSEWPVSESGRFDLSLTSYMAVNSVKGKAEV